MPKIVNQDYFANDKKFYRVIRGDVAAKDIQQSGMVRSAAAAGVDYESKAGPGKISLTNRPTKWPSFAKGSVNIGYAQSNPDHYIVETKAKLIPSSTAAGTGRHGVGSTYFPPFDPKTKQPKTSLPSSDIKLWKHVGEGKYQKVSLNNPQPLSSFQLGSPIPQNLRIGGVYAALGSAEQAYKEGKDLYKLGKGWGHSSGNSPEDQSKINKSWENLQKENPQYFDELRRLQEARQTQYVSVNNPQSFGSARLQDKISNLLRLSIRK